MTLMQANECTHDDLACLDVDLLLTEAMTEIADLKASRDHLRSRVTELEERLAAALHRAEMAQSLHAETDKRFSAVSSDRRMLAEQVTLLHEELLAAEKDALPADTLAHAVVSRDHVLALYRRLSRVSRGPVPRSVTAAVEAALADVSAAMENAGREALEGVVRREVRRRRRATRR